MNVWFLFFFFTFISYLYFTCDNLSIIFINFPNQYLLHPHYMLCKIGGKDIYGLYTPEFYLVSEKCISYGE